MTKKGNKNNLNKRPLGYRKKLLTELNAQYPRYNFKSNLLGGLFLLGIGLTMWEIHIFDLTFISLYIPLTIWILTGIIMTPVFKKTFNIYCFNQYTPGRTPLFFHIFFNVVSFGGISVFLFMWTNQSFSDKAKSVITLPIISYGHYAKKRNSCGAPYGHIVYKGLDKKIDFDCDIEIEKYSRVYIETSKGFFGFDIITNKTLIEGQW